MRNNTLGYNLEDLSSPGAQIIRIIRNELYNNVTTSFLAKIKAVGKNDGGKAVVDVELLNTITFNGKEVPPLTLYGLPVGIFGVKGWSFNIPLKKGDIGLCIACKWDISGYMETGDGGEPNTERNFNISDAIYLPLSMYLQPEIKDDLILTETGGDNPNTLITLKSDGTISIENKKDITVKSEGGLTGSHKKAVDVSTEDKLSVTSKKDMTVKSEGKINIEGKDNLSLKVGNCEIKISSNEVSINNNLTVAL